MVTSGIGHPHAGQRKADCQLFPLAVGASVFDYVQMTLSVVEGRTVSIMSP